MDAPLFEIPALFNVLCFVLGSVFLLGPVFWLWAIKYAVPDTGYKPLSSIVFVMSVRVVFLACVFSLFYGVNYGGGAFFAFVPEMLIIFFMSVIFVLRLYWRKAQNISFLDRVFQETSSQFSLVVCLVSFWLAGFFVVYGVFVLALAFGFPYVLEAFVMVLGGGGFAGLLLFHRHVALKKQDDLPDLFAFHNILWVIILGLLLFILPLMMDKFVHDPKWHKKSGVVRSSFKA